MANPVNLEKVVRDLGTNEATAGEAYRTGVVDMAGQVQKIQQEMQLANDKIIAATKAQMESERARELTIQAQQNKVMARTGMNVSDDASQFVQLSFQLDKKQQELSQSMQKRRELQGVGFIDNPLQWIFNQIELDFVDEDFKRLQAETSSISQLMHERAAAGKEGAQAVLAANSVKSEGEAAAAMQIAESQIKLASYKSNIEAMQFGTKALHEVYTSKREGLENQVKIWQIYAAKENDARDRALDSINLQRAQAALRQDLRSEKEQKARQALYQDVAVKLGYPVDKIMNLAPEALERLPGVVEAAPGVIVGGTIGSGPVSAMFNATIAGGKQLAPEWRQRTQKYINGIATTYEAKATAGEKGYTAVPKNPIEAQLFLDKVVRKQNRADSDGYDHDNTELYKLYPIGTWRKAAALKDNKFLQRALSGIDGREYVKQSDLIKLGVAAVDSGEMTSDQVAKDIVDIASWNLNAINRSIGAELFNVRKLDALRFTMPSGGMFGTKWAVNKGSINNLGTVKMLIDREIGAPAVLAPFTHMFGDPSQEQ